MSAAWGGREVAVLPGSRMEPAQLGLPFLSRGFAAQTPTPTAGGAQGPRR